MSSAWVLAADAGRARIFSADSPKSSLRPLKQLISPEARLREQDLTSDRPGRSFDSAGMGRHATEPSTHAREREALRFARDIARHLKQGRDSGAFDRLILVAEPRFLGLVRKAVDSNTAKMIALEVAKDVSKANAKEIRKHLPDRI